jgi:hypothetical protein
METRWIVRHRKLHEYHLRVQVRRNMIKLLKLFLPGHENENVLVVDEHKFHLLLPVIDWVRNIMLLSMSCQYTWVIFCSSNSTTSLPSQHVQCFRQTLQLPFPPNMFNAFDKLYNFSSLSTCSMLSSHSTTSLPSQHVQCFRQILQLLFPLNMSNAFLKLYKFDESIEHVEREEKL